LGAVMATTRVRLERIGGFAALLDYLADDYQLGHKITEQGGKIVLCPIVAECWAPPMNWKEVWTHQLRWARTIRTCQPWPYFLSILSNATLWPMLWLVSHRTFGVSITVLGCLVVRVMTALNNQQRLAPETRPIGPWWLILGKDLLNACIWALAFLGNDIQWRGEHYRVLAGGQLIKRAACTISSR
jgi:ceramide glucosyltransferase